MGYVFAISFVLIMIAEFADKSQLLALSLATRYKAWQVLTGIFAATFVVHFFTTLAGQTLGAFIPTGLLPWFTGLLFVGFGIWTLRGDEVSDSDAHRGAGRFGPVLATGVAFFFAELGDKTQVMTMTIAADPGSVLVTYLKDAGPSVQRWLEVAGVGPTSMSPAGRFWAVTLGSTLGMVIADALAIGVGRLLGKKLPERALRRLSGSFFIVFGVLAVASRYIGS